MSNDVLLVANTAVLRDRADGREDISQDNQEANIIDAPSRDDVIMPLKLSGSPTSQYAPHAHTETNNNKNMSTYVPNVILLGRNGKEQPSLSRNNGKIIRTLSTSSDSSDKQRGSTSDCPASEESLDISTTTYCETESDSGDSTSTTTNSAPGSPARSKKNSFDLTNTSSSSSTSITTATDTEGETETEPVVAAAIDAPANDHTNTSTTALSAKAAKNISNSYKSKFSEFSRFRIQYLIVHTAIMLADGLQGKQEDEELHDE